MTFFETEDVFQVRNFHGPIPKEYRSYPSSPGVLIALGANFDTPDPEDPRFVAAWNGDGPFGAGNHSGFVKIVLENLNGVDLDAIKSLGLGEKIEHEEFWGEYRFYLTFMYDPQADELVCDFDEYGRVRIFCEKTTRVGNTDGIEKSNAEFQSRVKKWIHDQPGTVIVVGTDRGRFHGPCESCGQVQDNEHRYTVEIRTGHGIYTTSLCKDCINFLKNIEIEVEKTSPTIKKNNKESITKRIEKKNKHVKRQEKQLCLFSI